MFEKNVSFCFFLFIFLSTMWQMWETGGDRSLALPRFCNPFFYIKCEDKYSFHIICIFVFLHLQSWILCVSWWQGHLIVFVIVFVAVLLLTILLRIIRFVQPVCCSDAVKEGLEATRGKYKTNCLFNPNFTLFTQVTQWSQIQNKAFVSEQQRQCVTH